MGGRQIVLLSTAGFSVINTVIFWREAKTKRLFSQCGGEPWSGFPQYLLIFFKTSTGKARVHLVTQKIKSFRLSCEQGVQNPLLKSAGDRSLKPKK
jgi:hypothetical protein